MAKIIILVFALLLASNASADAFTLNDNIEGYDVSLICKDGACKGTASKFIFTESFNAQYEMKGNNAIIKATVKSIKILMNLDLTTGAYTYDWNSK